MKIADFGLSIHLTLLRTLGLVAFKLRLYLMPLRFIVNRDRPELDLECCVLRLDMLQK
jgi:hypothetical protein